MSGKKQLAEKDGTNSAPGGRLIEVMGRNLVIALAIGAVLGAVVLCSIGIFKSTLVPSQTARFFLCLLTAFLFAVFVFTLYPNDYQLNIEKLIKIPFVLVGPAALWIALFLLLWYMLPIEGVSGKLFLPPQGGEQIPYSASWALSWNPSQPVFYKVRITKDQGGESPDLPAGFYVQFDPSHDEYRAVVGLGPSKDEIDTQYEVTFSRGATTYKLQRK
jgi:hypothetical protein